MKVRYRRDWWYFWICAGCSSWQIVSGAQINAGKRYCSDCR